MNDGVRRTRLDPTVAAGALLGLGAAALFGLGAPFSKRLVETTGPLTLAGLLYLGAGLFALVLAPVVRGTSGRRAGRHESPLQRADLVLLAGATASGAVLGPFLLMFGLTRVSAVTGSLLLNLEAPMTMLIAVAVYKEHLGGRQAAAAALVLLGAAIVGLQPGDLRSQGLGVLAIALASAAWAIDTNLSQRLSLRDPIALTRFKGLAGGACTLLFARAAGEALPGARLAGAGLLLGGISYGVSSILFYKGLRLVGAVRSAAYFGTAPFLGALAAIPVLGERLHGSDLVAMALMASGVMMLLRESHSHEHDHEELRHDHRHVHDEHHQHDHAPGHPEEAMHAHPHRHRPLRHVHPHVPDLHHRHPHD